MRELTNGSFEQRGVVKCVARCLLLCGACGITPIPGDELFGAVTGAASGAAGF